MLTLGQADADMGAAADAAMQSATGAEGQADFLLTDSADNAELTDAGSANAAADREAVSDGEDEVSISSKGNVYLLSIPYL